MILGRVTGTVVSTRRNDSMPQVRYLLVESCSTEGALLGDSLVAVDPLGAGPAEIVLVSQGSSARQTSDTDKKPVDAVVVGIVDLVETRGKVVYRK